MKKGLNIALLISFVLTIMVPLTGIGIHKLASTIFLLLCIVHSIKHKEKMGAKRYLLLVLVSISFITGLFGMIWEQVPMIMIWHRCLSIAIVFFMAIHIFVYHRK